MFRSLSYMFSTFSSVAAEKKEKKGSSTGGRARRFQHKVDKHRFMKNSKGRYVFHTNGYRKWCMIFKLDFHFSHHACVDIRRNVRTINLKKINYFAFFRLCISCNRLMFRLVRGLVMPWIDRRWSCETSFEIEGMSDGTTATTKNLFNKDKCLLHYLPHTRNERKGKTTQKRFGIIKRNQ